MPPTPKESRLLQSESVVEQQPTLRVRASVGKALYRIQLDLPVLVELLSDEEGELLELVATRDDFLPPVVGGAHSGERGHWYGEAKAGKYRVVEVGAGRIAELLPAQGGEPGHRAKGLGDVNLGGVVGFSGAQALVLVGSGELDLANQIQQHAALTTVEHGIVGAGDGVSETAFHFAASARQRF